MASAGRMYRGCCGRQAGVVGSGYGAGEAGGGAGGGRCCGRRGPGRPRRSGRRPQRLARLMEDPRGKELTIALTDQAFRSRRPARIADQLHYLLERYGAPRFMEWWERIGLTLGGVMGHYLPSLVVPPIVARLRHETESLILPGEEADLRRYLAERRRRRHPAQPEPARRGDPGRGGGRAPARGLPGAARPRRRRVHLGEGLLGLEPDRPESRSAIRSRS